MSNTILDKKEIYNFVVCLNIFTDRKSIVFAENKTDFIIQMIIENCLMTKI